MRQEKLNLEQDALLRTALGHGAQVQQPAKDAHPQAGKSYAKVTHCRNGECEGVIIKETEVTYPNPDMRMGGPSIPPHYAYRAFCNSCAICYDVTILERSLARPAP